MSLWICQHCHSLQGFAKTMRCFACGGPLEFTTVSTLPNVTPAPDAVDPHAEAHTDCQRATDSSSSVALSDAEVEAIKASYDFRYESVRQLLAEVSRQREALEEVRDLNRVLARQVERHADGGDGLTQELRSELSAAREEIARLKADCVVNPVMSRVCERGTPACIVKHRAPANRSGVEALIAKLPHYHSVAFSEWPMQRAADGAFIAVADLSAALSDTRLAKELT